MRPGGVGSTNYEGLKVLPNTENDVVFKKVRWWSEYFNKLSLIFFQFVFVLRPSLASSVAV